MDFDEGAPLLAMVQQNQLWTKPQKETISQAIHKKVQESMGNRGMVKERVQHQQFTWFPQFFTKSDWDLIMTAAIPAAQKCSVLMERLWKLDLRSPNEDTYAMITVVLLLTETERFLDAVQLRSSYLSVKGLVKGFLKNRLRSGETAWTYKDLPAVVGALESDRVANAYAAGEKPGALPEGFTMEYLQYWMNLVPQRSNSSSIAITFPKNAALQGQNMFGGMMMGHLGMTPMAFQQGLMPPGWLQNVLPPPASHPQAAAPPLALQYPAQAAAPPAQLALPAPPISVPAVAPASAPVVAPAVTPSGVTAPAPVTAPSQIEVVAPSTRTPVKKPLALTDGTVEEPKTEAPGVGGSSAGPGVCGVGESPFSSRR